VVTALTFVAGVVLAEEVAKVTNSGLGMCGPYGPHAGLVLCIILASFPVSLGVGIFSAWRFYRFFSKRAG